MQRPRLALSPFRTALHLLPPVAGLAMMIADRWAVRLINTTRVIVGFARFLRRALRRSPPPGSPVPSALAADQGEVIFDRPRQATHNSAELPALLQSELPEDLSF